MAKKRKQKVRSDRDFFRNFLDLSGRDKRIAKRRLSKMNRKENKAQTAKTNELLSIGAIFQRDAKVQRQTRRATRAYRRKGSPAGTKRSQTMWSREVNKQKRKSR